MYESVTVDEALKKGKRLLLYIPMAILFFFIFGCMWLVFELKIPGWFIIIGFIAGAVFSWAWWNIKVLNWKLWAFENVRNVYELRKRAIDNKLIYSDNSFFAKTEIRTKAFKEKWALLQNKFLVEDHFEDDFIIPDETAIYFSKRQGYLGVVLFGLMVIGGVFLIANNENKLLGFICLAIGGYSLFSEIKKLLNRKPQIIISNKGIQTEKVPFITWDKISGEDVIVEGFGKSKKHYFVYAYQEGFCKIDIADFDTNRDKLYSLLILYRGRYRKHFKPDH